MSLNFNQAAVTALQSAVISQAKQLDVFQRVYAHEPRNAPGAGLTLALWLGPIHPVKSSGLNSVSGVVTYGGRIYKSMLGANATEDDLIDAALLAALSALYGAYAGGFTLGETVRAIDLLGMEGTPFSATPGYLEMENKPFRVLDLVIPIIINDLWSESP
jgi:hypothetical protein